MDHGTFPGRLVERARRRGAQVALREKKYGIWQEVTWREYAAHVRAVALGLERLGVRPGDTLAVISGNRPAWLYVELAAQSIGATPLGIFVAALPEQVRRALDHSETRAGLAEAPQQPDKVLRARHGAPRLEGVPVDGSRAVA